MVERQNYQIYWIPTLARDREFELPVGHPTINRHQECTPVRESMNGS